VKSEGVKRELIRAKKSPQAFKRKTEEGQLKGKKAKKLTS